MNSTTGGCILNLCEDFVIRQLVFAASFDVCLHCGPISIYLYIPLSLGKPTQKGKHILAVAINPATFRQPRLAFVIHMTGVFFKCLFDIFDNDLALGAYKRNPLNRRR
jgi:hypothetical protein